MAITTYTIPTEKIVHNTSVDFSSRFSIINPIHIVQYDNSLPIISVELKNANKTYALPTNIEVWIRWKKPDNTFVRKQALGCNSERNTVYFEITQQMVMQYGLFKPVVELIIPSNSSNPSVASSGYFSVLVDRNPIQNGDIESTTEYEDPYRNVCYTKTAIDDMMVKKANITDVNAALSKKADKTDVNSALSKKADKTALDSGLKTKQDAVYLSNTVTSIDELIALKITHTVYTGTMSGFSTKFGASSDSVTKGFRMWFVLSKPNNDYEWHRIILLDDGSVWTASLTGKTFTQISYNKTQINQLLKSKADLDAYENVVELSITISTADQLNDYTDINKTYTFYAVPPLTTDLDSGAGTYFMLNNYSGGSMQIVRPVKDINKAFIREYSSTSHTWSKFKDISIHDKSITKEKLSADLQTEIAGKYDASNVEYGSGTLTGATGYENETATFNYQKVGNLVTVIGKATFSGESTTFIRLAGLPYRSISETGYVYTQFRSSKSKWIMVNTNYSVLELRHPTQGQVFEAEETLRFAIFYYTA